LDYLSTRSVARTGVESHSRIGRFCRQDELRGFDAIKLELSECVRPRSQENVWMELAIEGVKQQDIHAWNRLAYIINYVSAYRQISKTNP
jgi:hypothetical protein